MPINSMIPILQPGIVFRLRSAISRQWRNSLMLVLLPVLSVRAQVAELQPVHRSHLLTLGIGLEPQLTSSLQYAYRVTPAGGPYRSFAGLGVKIPPLIARLANWRVHAIWMHQWQVNDRWALTVNVLPYVSRATDQAGSITGGGVELRGMPLHYGARWTTGIDLGWQATIFSYVTHSQITRRTFQDRYPTETGPVNGWYRLTAQRFRLGFLAGRRINRRAAVQFNVGSLFSIQRQGILLGFAHAQFPLYAETHLVWDLE
jgi:hypothetical protein